MNDQPTETNATDLDWVALQYYLDELSVEARGDFEGRLAEDQASREALARAVEWTRAAAIVEATTDETIVAPRRTNPIWLTPTAWLSAAALACVALMVFWNTPHTSPRLNRPSVAAHSPLDSVELASHWVSTAEILISTTGNQLPVDDLFDSTDATDVPELEVARLQAPSWMMAAVATSTPAVPE